MNNMSHNHHQYRSSPMVPQHIINQNQSMLSANNNNEAAPPLSRQTSFNSSSTTSNSLHCSSPTRNTFQSTPPSAATNWSNCHMNNVNNNNNNYPTPSNAHSITYVNQSNNNSSTYPQQTVNSSSFHHKLNTSSPPPYTQHQQQCGPIFNNGNSDTYHGDLHSPNSNTSQAHSIVHLNSQHNQQSSPSRKQYSQSQHNSYYNSNNQYNNNNSNNMNMGNSPSSSSTCRFGPSLNNSSCDNMKGLVRASSLIEPHHNSSHYGSPPGIVSQERKIPPQHSVCINNNSSNVSDRYVNIYSPPTTANSNQSPFRMTNEESMYYPEANSCNNSHHYCTHAQPHPHHQHQNECHASRNIPSIQDWFDKHEHQVINSTRNITRRGSITKIDTTVVSSAGPVPPYQASTQFNNGWNDNVDVSIQDECTLTPHRFNKLSQPLQKSKISKPSKMKQPSSNSQTPVMVVNILGNEYSDFINEGTLVKKKKSIKFKYYTPKM